MGKTWGINVASFCRNLLDLGWARPPGDRTFDVNDKIAHVVIIDALGEFQAFAVVISPAGGIAGLVLSFGPDEARNCPADGSLQQEQPGAKKRNRFHTQNLKAASVANMFS